MTTVAHPDTLHRLIKEAIDRGAAATIEEAEALFRSYRLTFSISPEEAHRPAHQIALLTGIALARRVFLGGVGVTGPVDSPLAAPLALGATLGDAVAALGGDIQPAASPGGPRVSIGGPPQPGCAGFHIRTTFAGWRGGLIPAYSERDLGEGEPMPLAPMLSAALAVNEAFLHVRGEAVVAGRRAVGLSLWRPDPECDWLGEPSDEPPLRLLPSRLWLIGLGHLGQAYLWALGLRGCPARC